MAHNLLLADDSVTIQRVIELTFADEDINVTAVGDGQLAIERLDTDPPDIILADVDMPKRDGYEVAAYVKSRPKLAHIPVVLLTGAFEPIDQARAIASGSSDVLAKPFEPQMVINRVKELLGRKRQDEEATMQSEPPPPSVSSPQPAGRPQGAEASEPVSLDDYFDQLDAAFSNLQPGAQQADGADDIDWPSLDGAAALVAEQQPFVAKEPADVPVIAPPNPAAADFQPEASVPPAFAQGSPSASAGKPVVSTSTSALLQTATAGLPVAPSAPVAPIAPVAPVSKSNPFANLSAAKAEVAARPAGPAFTDEMIEEIVSRVLQRMSDRVVRETVADIVSQTAERLVQEEIQRIRTTE